MSKQYPKRNEAIWERFELRTIQDREIYEAAEIEQICFPPHEACSREKMLDRGAKAADLFLVAIEKSTGKMAGFLNGLSTNERRFRDEFFLDANLYDPDGKCVMLLGLDVLPEYRRLGLATELMNEYFRREAKNGKECLILTCLEEKVEMYKKMGYQDEGISDSTWGEESWHEMTYHL